MIEIPVIISAILVISSAGALLAYRLVKRREKAASLLLDIPAAGPTTLSILRKGMRERTKGRLTRRVRLAVSLALGLIIFAFTGNLVIAALPWPCMIVLERFSESRGRNKSRDKMEGQVLELIDSLNQSLRSGLSLQQSLEISVEDVGDELRAKVLEVLRELRLGSGLEAALAGAAASSHTPSLRLTLTVLGLLHGKGGDLPRILERLRKRVAEGLEARREARILTAQSRASGYLVSALPLVFLLLQAILNPRSLRPLFTTPTGNLIIIAAAGLNAAAFFLIRKIVNPEV